MQTLTWKLQTFVCTCKTTFTTSLSRYKGIQTYQTRPKGNNTYSYESHISGIAVDDVIVFPVSISDCGMGSIKQERFRYSGCVPVWPRLMISIFNPSAHFLINDKKNNIKRQKIQQLWFTRTVNKKIKMLIFTCRFYYSLINNKKFTSMFSSIEECTRKPSNSTNTAGSISWTRYNNCHSLGWQEIHKEIDTLQHKLYRNHFKTGL